MSTCWFQVPPGSPALGRAGRRPAPSTAAGEDEHTAGPWPAGGREVRGGDPRVGGSCCPHRAQTPARHRIEPWPVRDPGAQLTERREPGHRGLGLAPSCWSLGGAHGPIPYPTLGGTEAALVLQAMAGIQSQDTWVLLPFVMPPVQPPPAPGLMWSELLGEARNVTSPSAGVQATVLGPAPLEQPRGCSQFCSSPLGNGEQQAWEWSALPPAHWSPRGLVPSTERSPRGLRRGHGRAVQPGHLHDPGGPV